MRRKMRCRLQSGQKGLQRKLKTVTKVVTAVDHAGYNVASGQPPDRVQYQIKTGISLTNSLN